MDAPDLPAEPPLETPDHAETYDPGGAGDGVPFGRSGSLSFEDDDRTVEDYAAPAANLRDHLGEQIRLTFADPVDRMIGGRPDRAGCARRPADRRAGGDRPRDGRCRSSGSRPCASA